MTMHLVNLAKSSKSIFEFIFVPVITVFFFLNSRVAKNSRGANTPSPKGGGAVKNPALYTKITILQYSVIL